MYLILSTTLLWLNQSHNLDINIKISCKSTIEICKTRCYKKVELLIFDLLIFNFHEVQGNAVFAVKVVNLGPLVLKLLLSWPNWQQKTPIWACFLPNITRFLIGCFDKFRTGKPVRKFVLNSVVSGCIIPIVRTWI